VIVLDTNVIVRLVTVDDSWLVVVLASASMLS
jgi:predicted nucleic acid-binding protein